MSWDDRFFAVAELAGSWSKDPSSKIGAVAVIDNRVISTGYNGFPSGIYDTPSRLEDKETKYAYTIHAELNCILNAAKNGVSLKGAHLYVTGIPCCHECAKAVIQAGIYSVHMKHKPMTEKWRASFQLTKSLFNEAGVFYECIPYPEGAVRGDEPGQRLEPEQRTGDPET